MLVTYDICACMRDYQLSVLEGSEAWGVTPRTVYLWRKNHRCSAAIARLVEAFKASRPPDHPRGWAKGYRRAYIGVADEIATQLLGPHWRDVLARREATRLRRQGFRKYESQHVIDFGELSARAYMNMIHARRPPLPGWSRWCGGAPGYRVAAAPADSGFLGTMAQLAL